MKHTGGVIYHGGYYRAARVLRLVRYAVLSLLLLFTLVTFLTFRQDMTLNHFRYLLNNFDFSPNASSTSGDTIYYDGDAEASFGFVSGGLVTLTDTRVFVTDRSSSTTLSAYHGYRQPMGAYSDRYMVIYDRKGSTAKVFNAFSLLKTYTYDGTVTMASAADNGNFATVVADVDRYYTKVFVYGGDLSLLVTVSKYKYVTAIDFTPDGESLLIVSRYTDDGKMKSELVLLDVAKKEARFTLTLDGAIYGASAEEDYCLLLGEAGVTGYDYEGRAVSRTIFSETPHKSALLSEGVITAVSGADSRRETLSYYTGEGVYTFSLPSRLVLAREDADFVYLLLESGICLFDKQTKAFTDVSSSVSLEGALTLLSDGSRVYLAYTHRADRLDGKTLILKNFENTAR